MEDSIVQQFLNYLRFEKRFSEHTAKCYGADLRQFGEFLLGSSDGHGSSMAPVSLAQEHGGSTTAVATQTERELDQ
jgi:site-specific recombinase XerD